MYYELLIVSEEPVLRKDTGIIIKRNGRIFTLKDYEEVKEYRPYTFIKDIEMIERESYFVWEDSASHYLAVMASHIPVGKYTLYDLLWRPEEFGFTEVNEEFCQAISEGCSYLDSHREELEKFNPPINKKNGERFGDYDTFCTFCNSLSSCLGQLNYKEKRYTIKADVTLDYFY